MQAVPQETESEGRGKMNDIDGDIDSIMAIEALKAYRKAQGRMLDNWAEGDAVVKNSLWKNLHACQQLADIVLAKWDKSK